MKNLTTQEKFWTSDFISGYIDRNNLDDKICNIPSRAKLFSEVIDNTTGIESVLEFGANIGLNMLALQTVKKDLSLSAIEINKKAFEILDSLEEINSINGSILDLDEHPIQNADLTFTSGVLIHISPDHLDKVYENLYKFSNKYILVAEYYNPTPVSIPYHGVEDVLFKRDFAGDLLDKYSDLKLVNYGFKYRRDNNYPLGDLTWFLLEKE